jgi:hypothetical protein
MSIDAVIYTITQVPSTSLYTITYTFSGTTYYLGAQFVSGSWQFWNTAGASQAYNQHTLTCAGVGQYTIYNAAVGYYLAGQNTMYGPYLNWYTTQAVWSTSIDPNLGLHPVIPSSSPIKRSGTNTYISGSGNPYEGSSPTSYTFTLVQSNDQQDTEVYTISQGGDYLSGNPNNYGFQTNLDNYAQFLIYQVEIAPIDHRIVYLQNIGAQAFNGYGWLCDQSTPYGPYTDFAQRPCAWNLTAASP